MKQLTLHFVAVTLASFATGTAQAIAQTTYPFEATFNSEITNRPLSGNVFETSATSESADAPYGLTNLTILSYTQIDFNTGVATFNSDPATFGLEGFPFGTLAFSGNGSDQLFGTISGTANSDSSTITITDGEGRFVGATGILNGSQTIVSSPDPGGITAPIITRDRISGSFQTPQAVPEPETNATLIGIGAVSVGFLLRRRNKKAIA